MKILIEECRYDPNVLEGVLPRDRLMLTDDKVKVENVGYFRSADSDDFVFFLPKVVLKPVEIGGRTIDRVFCTAENPEGLSPEEIIDPVTAVEKGKLGEREKDFLYEFAVWIYRAIARYESAHEGTDAVWRKREKQSSGFRRRYVTNTLLDVILALHRFHRDNQDYFTFKVKEKHSGLNKINWPRTISKSPAIVQDGVPLYLQPRTKRKVVNFDEELLVIFYSILDYANRHYGFKVRFNLEYELIPPAEFTRYLAGYGEVRLRHIKYKYFSDRDLELWDLCFAFFHKAHRANVVSEDEEYLLAKNFEIIFEAMIDDLIGDPAIVELKELSDGKEIDHLYLDDSLTRADRNQTFYIADSKYYKRGNSLGGESVAKQFTYAKNILQLDLDLFLNGPDASEKVLKARSAVMKGKEDKVGLLRDEATEGYDIIPNFFISATIGEDMGYDEDRLDLHGDNTEKREYRNIHFENRLFDRDTLLLSHYDVNFLYVLKLYAQDNRSTKEEWRRTVHNKFKAHVRSVLESHFSFHALMPYDELTDADAIRFLRENFRETLGKVYSPYPKVNGKSVYSLALEKPDAIVDERLSPEGLANRKRRTYEDNKAVKALLERAFYIVDSKLGDDPTRPLQEMAAKLKIPGATVADVSDNVIVAEGYKKGHIEAVRKSCFCPWNASSCKYPFAVQMLVFPHTNQADIFKVDDSSGPWGPMPPETVKVDYPEFAGIELPFNSYYVWKVLPPPPDGKNDASEEAKN